MQLSSIISTAVTLNTMMGVTQQKKAVAAAVEVMRKDEESTDEARYIAASKLVHDQTTKTMRALPDDPRQGSFFALRTRYALDADARIIKDTDRLSMLEFKRIMELRRKQIADDTVHYNHMTAAWSELEPIWQEYPDKLFGEVEAIYLRRRRNGNGHAAA
jgi:hypothetical protein